MGEQRQRGPGSTAAWLRSSFWDAVEIEIARPSWLELLEFVSASLDPVPMRREFPGELREALRALFHERFST
ncbi:MAG: hypothetical protein ACE5FG_13080 [Myxococcota bacterium]